jgi:hypothetical protein
MDATSDAEIEAALAAETIAVVGCSTTPGKAAHDVPKYLLEHGYDVIPVNPHAEEVFGREALDSLADVDREIDLVTCSDPRRKRRGSWTTSWRARTSIPCGYSSASATMTPASACVRRGGGSFRTGVSRSSTVGYWRSELTPHPG